MGGVHDPGGCSTAPPGACDNEPELECIAYNKNGGKGVYAVATCGHFTHSSNWHVRSKAMSSTEYEWEARASCDEGTEVVGCTCQSDDFSCLGSEISGGVCKVFTASPGKTRSTAHARCATIGGAEHPDNWRTIKSLKSGNCNSCTSTAVCNSMQGEFLTQCMCSSYMATGKTMSCNGVIQQDSNLNGQTSIQCIAQNRDGGVGVYAIARCGRISVEKIQISMPTSID